MVVGSINLDALKSFALMRSQVLPPVKSKALVLGSGPNPIIPDDYDPATWSLVTINASQASVPHLTPDITLLGASTLRNKPANVEAKQALRGLRTGSLILFKGRQMPDRKRFRLLRIGYSYRQVTFLRLSERARWNQEVMGIDPSIRPSNGVSTAALCCWLGARTIVMTGFSLTKEGHAYNNKNRERAHVGDDRIALRRMIDLGLPVYTTQSDFAEESGLALWQDRPANQRQFCDDFGD